jgi:phosphate starvation-inducible protein PhoH and related proteins
MTRQSNPSPEPNAAETVVNVVLAPDDHRRMANLCGQFDEHIHQIEQRLGLRIKSRGNHFELTGTEAATSMGARVLQELFAVTEHELLDAERVHMTLVEHANFDEEPGSGNLIIHARRRDIRARGANQVAYTRAMRTRDLVFGIGPAGTGKTYLAVAAAVEALSRDAVRRLVLVRPAVEAGERLGFLPGDMSQKVDPYLRPMYDALYEMLGFERVGKLIDRHIIEVAPLAFMRGRTLNESFIILDEAQNTTAEQMKMFLTRIGFGSRAVVTGDVTQTDLPRGRESGLNHVTRVLEGVEGVEFVHFGPKDVVRHPLVQSIVAAYAKDEARRHLDDEPPDDRPRKSRH